MKKGNLMARHLPKKILVKDYHKSMTAYKNNDTMSSPSV
jgi:hypothetical protein